MWKSGSGGDAGGNGDGGGCGGGDGGGGGRVEETPAIIAYIPFNIIIISRPL